MSDEFKSKFLNSKIWILLFTGIIAYIVTIYFERIPLDSISEGDIGRDLYNFYLVSKGQIPYIDFRWIYGPLVPLIYGLLFKLCGVSMLNALSLFFIIHIIVFFLMFILIKNFSNNFFAFLVGLLFVSYYGFSVQTFNHITGIIFILLALLFLKLFLDTEKKLFLYLIAISCFLLTIVKLNMGLAISGPIVFFLFLFKYLDKKPVKHIIYSILLFLGLTIFTYGLLISLSPSYLIGKCFPYSSNSLQGPVADALNSILGADNAILSFNPIKNMDLTLLYYLTSLNLWYFIIIIIGFVYAFIIFKKEKFSSNLIFVVTLSVASLLSTHEFIKIGTFYSLRFWTLPLVIPLLSFIACYSVNTWNTKKYFKPAFITCCILLFSVLSVKLFFTIKFQKFKSYYYLYDRAKVKFTDLPWLILLAQTVDYIEKNSSPDDKILSLPYNMLPIFISKRESPSVLTEFLFLSDITLEDQKRVINDLIKQRVKLILYTERPLTTIKRGAGTFGLTHCVLLDKYIKDNYKHDVTLYYHNRNLLFLFPISFYKRKTPFKPVTEEYLHKLMQKNPLDDFKFL